MPVNPATRQRDTISGTSKLPEDTQMVLMFGFIGLHECGAALEGLQAPTHAKRRGQRAQYPVTALLAILGCARAARSLANALKTLHDNPDLWRRCCEAYQARARTGDPLPPVPPSRAQVEYFRQRLIADPEAMQRLQHTFRRSAIGQARALGNLQVGITPDWSRPLESHSIYGDGTHISKYSEVREVYDPFRDEVRVVGSRAKEGNKPRIQRLSSDSRADGKTKSGLNMVAMHTYTPAGRVTLGTATALRAEAWAALQLAEELHALAGDGIHTLIYDRAITGWHVDHLMANLRIQVIGKAVGAKAESSAWSQETDHEIQDLVHRRLAEVKRENDDDLGHMMRRDAVADMLRYHDRQPLGLCVYPTKDRNMDVVRSWGMELDPVVHTTPNGECLHRIALDDGGLYEIDDHPEGGYVIKIRVLRCTSSIPVQRADGRWSRRSTYPIPCPDGEDVTFTHLWEPEGVRYTAQSTEKDRSPSDPVGWRLRPLSRADDLAGWYNDPAGTGDPAATPKPFEMYGRRNDAESFNEWYQQTLRHHGRATSLDPVAQGLDFVMGALLNNAITWHHRI